MLCKKPYMAGNIPYGCGQCLPCRINRGRQWTWRQYLESLCHEENCFVTLTYDTAHIRGDWSLDPDHLQMWLKRLRKVLAPRKIRYFAVGEYGGTSRRPHYHLSLFGVSAFTICEGVPFERIVNQTWGKGYTSVFEFNEATAQYTCGYVVKKLIDRGNPWEWNTPEFARMSLRPGIGAPAMEIMAKALLSTAHAWESGDVPKEVRIGNRTIGLGRYMLHQLRRAVGFSDLYVQQVRDDKSIELSLEVLAMYENQKGSLTFKEAHAKEIAQKLLQVEARYKIWQTRHKGKSREAL